MVPLNSGPNSGLVDFLREETPWAIFVWCILHRLESVLKNALADFIAPIDEALKNIFFIYKLETNVFIYFYTDCVFMYIDI